MTEQYQQAVASLPDGRAPEWQPALHELDESAAQIRAALAQDRVRRTCLASSSAPMRCGWN
jgi:hypothetical protein